MDWIHLAEYSDHRRTFFQHIMIYRGDHDISDVKWRRETHLSRPYLGRASNHDPSICRNYDSVRRAFI
jgi:hypothetical protein